jgi:outer membrane protein assembly factor BamA
MPVAELRVEMEGAPKDLAGELVQGLALRGDRGVLRATRATFFPETLSQDLTRCRLFLARHGYPDAELDVRLEPADGDRAVRVTLVVTPGPEVTVGRVQLLGLPDGFASRALPVAAGDHLLDAAARDAAAQLEESLREAGHARARVTLTVERRGTRADVTLEAAPGPVCTIDSVRVEGAAPDLEPLVRSTLDLRPGERYSPSKLRAADAGLRELDLFRLIRVRTEPHGDTGLIVVCELTERQPRTVSVGVGYLSDEQVRVEAEWRHRNQFRAGRGARLGGRASLFLQTLRADVTWPRFVGTRTRGTAGASMRREDEDAYRLLDLRLDFTASRKLGRTTRGNAGVAVSWIDVDVRTSDPELDDPVGLVTSFPLSWIRDTSDDLFSPRRGSLARVDVEAAPPGLGSVAEYARTEARVSLYRPLPASSVLAARILGGAARPLGDSPSVLAGRRLFAGGSRSMRGFGRRRLGPKDADGEPLGGEAKIEVSAELRFPILGRVAGAAFLDGAQVWEDRHSVRLRDLEWAAGPALMIRSPVGPLRLDWGFLFEPVDGEPRSVLHFSVGHPY